MNPEYLNLHENHIKVPFIKEQGQEKILNSKILVVGAGGIGSPLLQYLAASGVGEIGIVDYDNIEESNLHRQILYGTSHIGLPKSLIAKNVLNAKYPSLKCTNFQQKISSSCIKDIALEYDYIIDATDNIQTTYLLHDFSFNYNKLFYSGSVSIMDGQIFSFDFEKIKSPCLRCLWPKAPKATKPETVFGVIPGIIALVLCKEILLNIVDRSTTKQGFSTIFSGEDNQFDLLKFRPRPDCPLCSK